MTGFCEFGATSCFSFLQGASRPEEIVAEARRLGLTGIGIADRNTLAGVVRAYDAHKHFYEAPDCPIPPDRRPKLAVGARLVFRDGTPDVLAYPEDRSAYGRLCRLLTLGKGRARKGECHLALPDLLDYADGLLLALVPPRRPGEETRRALVSLRDAAPGSLWLAASMPYGGNDRRRLRAIQALAAEARVPLLATNDVLYHAPERRSLQDVLACIRQHETIETIGRRLEAHAERHLKGPAEMVRLFRGAPDAVAETLRFLDRIQFCLSQIAYAYPDEPVPPGSTPQEHLERLTWEGAAQRYLGGVPEKVARTLREELALIAQLDYARYFLTVHDIVRFANSQGILCQGRGSAANSAVCYVLGITAVDPTEIDLLFARFVSAERSEPPDIDVDFEHERREEVIQYIYARYGRHRAALCATVISYRPRSAIRDVGKAMGLSEDVTAALAGTVWGSWGTGLSDDHVRQAGLDPANPLIRKAVDLAVGLIGFPRHLSQHVGGFILGRDRLDETVPLGPAAMEGRTFIEWDKDDIDRLGLMKVDVLALGMLTCIRRAFALVAAYEGRSLTLATVPGEDKPTYDMLSRGDSLGVFQVESRAQMNMLPRLKPQEFYDLVIEVAIVRPGPIQGDMVHPYLRRRQRREVVEYPFPKGGEPNELRRVLEKTLGVPLFQEQAMKIAMVAAEFTADEANGLRRAMATFRHVGTIHTYRDRMVERMVARGYERSFAERCFSQIEGFGTYGFPESHAASFAILVYVSAYLKRHHPAAFAAALLNSQPMGFYAPADIVRDARDHGVEVRPVDVAASCWDCTLERAPDGRLALRLGLRQIEGLQEGWAESLVVARERQGWDNLESFVRRSGLPRRAIVMLADADALHSLGLPRREALWAVRRLPDDAPLPLFAHADADERPDEGAAALPAMPLSEDVVADFQTTRLSLKGHPLQFLRELFRAEGAQTTAEIGAARDGRRARLAGLVLVRQKPGTSKGVVFMTLGDETGVANVVVWPSVGERYRREVMGARLLLVEGRIQRSPEGIVHLVAERLVDRTEELRRLSEDAFAPPLARADEVVKPQAERGMARRHPREAKMLPKSRDFH